jgi:hypothetical protein
MGAWMLPGCTGLRVLQERHCGVSQHAGGCTSGLLPEAALPGRAAQVYPLSYWVAAPQRMCVAGLRTCIAMSCS